MVQSQNVQFFESDILDELGVVKMPPLCTTMKSIELTFPLSFLKTVVDVEITSNIFTAKLNQQDCILNINKTSLTENNDQDITFRFPVTILSSTKHKRLRIKNNCLKCKFSNISEKIADEFEVLMPVITSPRVKGRGRPKKAPMITSITQEQLPLFSTNDDISSVGRYSLRGVKLSSKIMKLEKSQYEEEIESDSDCENNVESNSKSERLLDPSFVKPEAFEEMCIDYSEKDKIMDNSNVPEIYISPNSTEIKRNVLIEAEGTLSPVKGFLQGKSFMNDLNKPDTLTNMKSTELNIESITEVNTNSLEKATHSNKQSTIKCLLCIESEIFLSKKQLRIHEKETHGNLQCMQCGTEKKYKHLYSLKSHYLWMHGENSKSQKHMCHLCPSRFKFVSTLRQHIGEIHEQKSSVQCKVCKKLFYRSSQLKRHEKIHGDATTKLRCEICNKGFWHDTNLQRHIRLVHRPQLDQFDCSYCGKGFTQKAGMISHIIRLHMNLTNFKCGICSQRFAKSKELVHHMIKTHKEKNFVVGEQRPTRFKYNRTPSDLLHCVKCEKTFLHKAELIEHMYIDHADSFPYMCMDCHQGFRKQPFLNRHKKQIHKVTLSAEEEDEIAMSVSHENAQCYMLDGEENVSSTDVVTIVGEDGTTYLATEMDQLETEGKLTYFDINNVTYVTAENNDVENNENVTYVTNYEYDNMEEVVTSADQEIKQEFETIGEQVLIEVEQEGENMVHYVIHPIGKSQNLGPEDIANLLMAAKEATTGNARSGNVKRDNNS